jgi:hypothetical protein
MGGEYLDGRVDDSNDVPHISEYDHKTWRVDPPSQSVLCWHPLTGLVFAYRTYHQLFSTVSPTCYRVPS